MAIKLTGVTTHGKKDELGFNPLELVPNFSAFTGRKERTPEAIEKMAASLLLHGQEQAFSYRKDFNGRPVPVSGHTRILAAAKITNEGRTGANGVTYSTENPFVVYGTYKQMNELEAVIHTFVENDDETRTPINDVDIAFLIRTLSETFGISDAEIAEKLGKPASFVSTHRTILELDPASQAALANGEIKFDTAVNVIAKIEPAKRAEAIATAKTNNKGRATSAAVAQAAAQIGAATNKPLKRTDADMKAVLNKYITDHVASPLTAVFFAISDFRAGTISEAEFVAIAEAAEVATFKAKAAA